MQKMKLIRNTREIETLFGAYLEIIYGARQDTLRIVSSLEAITLNVDILAGTGESASGSPEGDKADLRALTAQVRSLALMALAAAKRTVTMIQANIPKAQNGMAKASEMLVKLSREELMPGESYGSFMAVLAEIKSAVRQVEKDAVRCVAAVRGLLPQVQNLQNRVQELLPPGSEDDVLKKKKSASGRKLGAHLYPLDTVH